MSDLPEAPVSLTFKIAYKGIEILATKRELKAEIKPYLENAKVAIDWALTNGFEVPVKGFAKGGFPPKQVDYVEGRVCPKCENKLVYSTTKAGKKFIKCSTNKWDFATKQSTGCSYVDWMETAIPNIPNNSGPSMPEGYADF
jgi:hypothetical protein